MKNADKIRNMQDEELAETYAIKVTINSSIKNEITYYAKHVGKLFKQKNDAIKAELEWLQSENVKD